MCKRKRSKLVHQNDVNYWEQTRMVMTNVWSFCAILNDSRRNTRFYLQTIEFTLNKTKSRLMPDFEVMLMLRNNFKLIVVRHKNSLIQKPKLFAMKI